MFSCLSCDLCIMTDHVSACGRDELRVIHMWSYASGVRASKQGDAHQRKFGGVSRWVGDSCRDRSKRQNIQRLKCLLWSRGVVPRFANGWLRALCFVAVTAIWMTPLVWGSHGMAGIYYYLINCINLNCIYKLIPTSQRTHFACIRMTSTLNVVRGNKHCSLKRSYEAFSVFVE